MRRLALTLVIAASAASGTGLAMSAAAPEEASAGCCVLTINGSSVAADAPEQPATGSRAGRTITINGTP